jgi:hypothetical protein
MVDHAVAAGMDIRIVGLAVVIDENALITKNSGLPGHFFIGAGPDDYHNAVGRYRRS